MRFGLLIVGTVLTALFIIQMIRGSKYDSILENLIGKEYTLSEIYSVGMAWQDTLPMLSHAGVFGQKMSPDVALVFGVKYREYYVRVLLAKAYTFVHLGSCAAVLLGMLLFEDLTGVLVAVVGVVISIYLAANVIKTPAVMEQKISDELTIALPNMATKLALLVNSCVILREAWLYVAAHSEGKLKEYLEISCDQISNGCSLQDAIYQFGNASTSKEVKKLASAMIQGIDKGNSELTVLLRQQAQELWATKRQRMLQKGEEAATKLLAPTMLMFVGLILVIVVSSTGSMGL